MYQFGNFREITSSVTFDFEGALRIVQTYICHEHQLTNVKKNLKNVKKFEHEVILTIYAEQEILTKTSKDFILIKDDQMRFLWCRN